MASLNIVMNHWVFAGSHLEAISFVDAKRKEQICIPLGFFLLVGMGFEYWEVEFRKKYGLGNGIGTFPSGPSFSRAELCPF